MDLKVSTGFPVKRRKSLLDSMPSNVPLTPYKPKQRFISPLSDTFGAYGDEQSLPSPRMAHSSATHSLYWYGCIMGCLTVVYFAFNLYTLVISKLLPRTGIDWMDWVGQDHYYCYLLPLLGPVFVFFIFFNWLGMKYFRQNASF